MNRREPICLCVLSKLSKLLRGSFAATDGAVSCNSLFRASFVGLDETHHMAPSPTGIRPSVPALSDPAERVAVTVARRDGCMVDIVGWTGKCPYL